MPKRTAKRGFKTKEEAEEWERRLKSKANIRILTLSEFFRVFARDFKPTVAASTWENKAALFRDKIEPYLGGNIHRRALLSRYIALARSNALYAQKGRLSLFAYLSQNDKQPARRDSEPSGQLPSARAKPHEWSSQDGKEEGQGDELLDEGGIPYLREAD